MKYVCVLVKFLRIKVISKQLFLSSYRKWNCEDFRHPCNNEFFDNFVYWDVRGTQQQTPTTDTITGRK